MSQRIDAAVLRAVLDPVIDYLSRLHAVTPEQAEFGNAMLQHIRWIRDGVTSLPDLPEVEDEAVVQGRAMDA